MRMNAKNNIISLSFVLLVYLPNQLISVDPCIYDVSDKGIIDLRSVGRKDGTPAWKNMVPSKSDGHGKCDKHLLSD